MHTYNNSHCKRRFQRLRLQDVLCIIVLVCVWVCVCYKLAAEATVAMCCPAVVAWCCFCRLQEGETDEYKYRLPLSAILLGPATDVLLYKKRRIYPQKQIV